MLKVPNFEADGRADEKAKSLDLRNMYYRDRQRKFLLICYLTIVLGSNLSLEGKLEVKLGSGTIYNNRKHGIDRQSAE